MTNNANVRQAINYDNLISVTDKISLSISVINLFNNLDEVFDELIPNDFNGFYLYNPDKDFLELISAKNFRTTEKNEAEKTALERHPGYVFKTGKCLLEKKHGDNPIIISIPKTQTINSRLYVPLVFKNERIGVIGLTHKEENRYSEDDLHLLQFIANIAVITYKRLSAEEEKSESELVIKSILDNTDNAIIMADGESLKIINANQKANELFEKKEKGLNDINILDLLPSKLHADISGITNKPIHKEYELTIQKRNAEKIYLQFSVNVLIIKRRNHLQLTFKDITVVKNAQLKVNALNALYNVVVEISSRLILSNSDIIKEDINYALKTIGKFVDVDRAYIFDYIKETDVVRNTFEWCNEGVKPEMENLQNIPFSLYSNWKEKFLNKEHIYVPSVDELSEEFIDEKKLLISQGIKSFLAVPIIYSNQFIGFAGFDSVKGFRTWQPEYVSLLKVAMNIIVNNHYRIINDEKIKSTKEFYEKLISELPNDIAVFDRNHKYLFVNKKAIKDDTIRKWIIGKDDFDYTNYRKKPIEPILERKRKFDEALKTRQRITWNEVLYKKDNTTEIITRNFVPVYKENGELRYIIGYALDTTSIFNLEKRQNILVSILEKIPAIIIHYSGNNKEIFINEHGKKQLLIEDENTLLPSLEELHDESSLDLVINTGLKAVNTHGFWQGEVLAKRKDGTLFHAEEIILKNQDNNGLSIIIIDVSERVKAIEEIKNLSTFPLENPNPVLRFDAEGNILFHNEASQLLINYWKKHYPNNLPSKLSKQLFNAIFNGNIYNGELITESKIYRYHIHPNSKKGYCNLYAEDVTESKLQENYLKQTDILLRSLSESASILLSLLPIQERLINSLKIIGINLVADYCSLIKYDITKKQYTLITSWARSENADVNYYETCSKLISTEAVIETLINKKYYHDNTIDNNSYFNNQSGENLKTISAFSHQENELELLILTIRFNEFTKVWRDFEVDVVLTYIEYVINVLQKETLLSKLHEKQLIQKALLDASPDNIMLIKSDGLIIEANYRYKETLNIAPENLMGKSVYKVFEGMGFETRIEIGKKILEEKKPIFFEDERDNKSFETYLYPVLNENHEVIYIASYARDISSKKQAQQEIKITKQKLESIFNEIQDVVWSVSAKDEKYVLMTPSVEKLYGYSAEEFNEDRDLWKKVMHPDDQYLIQALEDKLKLKGYTEEEYRIITKTGEIKWIRNRTKAIYNREKELIRLDGYTIDITDRKKYEQEIKESEESYRNILENSSEMIQTLDLSGKIVWTNRSWRENLGVDDSDSIKEVALIDFLDDATLAEFNRVMPMLMQGNIVTDLDCTFISRKGNHLKLVGRAVPLYKNNVLVGTQAYLHDITKIILAEKELEQLNKNLEQLVDQRTHELNESNKNLQNFAYVISHDLKAPVRHATMFAHILKSKIENKLDKDELRLLDNISYAGDKMGKLIDGMLEFNKLGNKRLEIKPIHTEALVARLIDMYKSLYKELEIDILVDKLPDINADEALIEQVFSNIISNAIKYSSKKSIVKIDIKYKDEQTQHYFSVKDNGTGFDMKHSTNMFNIFTRLHAPGEFDGNGIGMANTKRIIERHKGTIGFYSEPDKGAEFYFTIPKKQIHKI